MTKYEMADEKRRQILAALASGPMSMRDLMAALGAKQKSELVRQVTALRDDKKIRLIGLPRSRKATWALEGGMPTTESIQQALKQKRGGSRHHKGNAGKSPMSEEEQLQIVQLWNEGLTGQQLADKFNRQKSSIYRALHAHGVDVSAKHPRPKKYKPGTGKGNDLTDDEKARIIELYKSGVRGVDIPAMIGRGQTAIWRLLKAEGLTRGGYKTGHFKKQDDTQVAVKSLVAPGHTNGVAHAARATMMGRGKAFNGLSLWQGQLTKLVDRIRKADPGVVSLEVDIQNGDFTVNRNSTEKGQV